MIRLFQSEWHKIKFNSFIICSQKKIADEKFYNSFYSEFFNKFNSFDDLDESWICYKKDIAKQILKQSDSKMNILSIGCGIGIVEKYLIEQRQNINITAIEPSANTSQWIADIPRISLYYGYFPDVLKSNVKFDLAYANCIDYVFEDKQYLEFLKSIVNYGIKEFLTISVSYYKPSFKLYLKESVKDILGLFGLYQRGQFWGYLRTIEEQINIMKEAGFNNVLLVYQSDNTIIIKAQT